MMAFLNSTTTPEHGDGGGMCVQRLMRLLLPIGARVRHHECRLLKCSERATRAEAAQAGHAQSLSSIRKSVCSSCSYPTMAKQGLGRRDIIEFSSSHQ
jgi:hypothetical protein